MKKILIILSLVFAIVSCETEDNFIDTGISNGTFDGNMMEYFASDPYNWELTQAIIIRGGLENMFNGSDSNFADITFFGPTSHSIRRWMLGGESFNPILYNNVSEIPVDVCRDMILMHVINERLMKEDIPGINPTIQVLDPEQDGGVELTTEGGNVIFAYTEQGDFGGVPRSGAINLRLHSRDLDQKIPVASPDIVCDNGVIHSLNYTYTFGGL
ncbi:fasciclin domain-containing protein [Flavivirga eckloniae]|uniref:FAS1 domain-containing protein n=1 Tax=Flavivirga eckloniae TaxID=1803846 RepID=A0A2K9PUF7_9FLAO|nr:fasciclin domain-containing protein [Flavivirga eckloniae]AUP80177.1 hypothetical protein C1H87_16260 [Flavivirga eckloniae]